MPAAGVAHARRRLGHGRERRADESDGKTLGRAVIEGQQAVVDAVVPAGRSEELAPAAAAGRFGLRPELIDRLVALRLVSLHPNAAGESVFTGADLEVLATVGHLDEVGLSQANGFAAEDLTMYRQALETLLEREVRTFMRVLAGADRGVLSPALAKAAVDGATQLLLALRKKTVADYLAKAIAEIPPETLG